MNAAPMDYALNNQRHADFFDLMNTAMANQATSAAGLAIGTSSAAAVKIGNTVDYTVDNVAKSKTTAEVAFTATTHDIPANASSVQEAVYLMTLNAAGTPTLTMGAIATGSGNAKLPERPATGTPIGYVRIAIAAGATPFDASTDLLSAGHITDTYVDIVGPLYPRFDASR